MKPFDQTGIRLHNLTRLWEVLQLEGEATRQTLSEKTNLSLMTVSNLVDTLQQNMAIGSYPLNSQAGTRRAAGRRAEIIHPNRKHLCFLIIDLSDRFFRFSLWGVDGSMVYQSESALPALSLSYEKNLACFLQRLHSFLKADSFEKEVLGTAVISPGPYYVGEDRVFNKRVPELNQLHLKRFLGQHIPLPNIYIEEDVKFAACAYFEEPSWDTGDPLFYLYLGEGVGGAILCKGEVLRGFNAVAGDVGQLTATSGQSFESHLGMRAFAASLKIDATDQINTDELLTSLDAFALQQPAAFDAGLMLMADVLLELLYSLIWLIDPKAIRVDCRYLLRGREKVQAKLEQGLKQRLAETLPRLPMIQLIPNELSVVYKGALRQLNREWLARMVNARFR